MFWLIKITSGAHRFILGIFFSNKIKICDLSFNSTSILIIFQRVNDQNLRMDRENGTFATKFASYMVT